MSVRARLLKTFDAAVGPVLCALLSRRQDAPERRRLSDFPGGRILVIRPGGIGDAVLLLPMLSALRAAVPESPVDVLCEGRNAPFFGLCPEIDRILVYDAHPFSALRALRRVRYAAVLDTEQFHNFSAVLAARTRAPLRIGFNVNPNRLGLFTHCVNYDLAGPEDAQFLRLLCAALGRDVPLPPRFGILSRARLPSPPPDLPSRFVLLHAGGSVSAKRWPADRYALLCRNLTDATGLPVVLTGSSSDVPFAARIAEGAGEAVRNLCGRHSLPETAALCAAASLLVGPDSGLAHLSVALGTPSVVLFGPSDPVKWGPPPEAGEAVRLPLPCSPCSMFGYTKPCRGRDCLCGLSVDEVLQACLRWIAKREKIK